MLCTPALYYHIINQPLWMPNAVLFLPFIPPIILSLYHPVLKTFLSSIPYSLIIHPFFIHSSFIYFLLFSFIPLFTKTTLPSMLSYSILFFFSRYSILPFHPSFLQTEDPFSFRCRTCWFQSKLPLSDSYITVQRNGLITK